MSDLAPKVPLEEIEVVDPSDALTEQERADQELGRIQDELFAESIGVVRDQLAFREIEPGATRPPEEWVEAYGPEEALKKFRVASSSWMSRSEAPVALDTSTKIVLGIIRARATEKAGPRSLSIAIVSMPVADTAAPQFPMLEVDDD